MAKRQDAVQSRRLTKRLGGRCVLREIDLEVAAGECVALTGINGAGKTTLLRCLAAIARPTTGEVRWFGQPAAFPAERRRLVGVVAHESCLYAHLTLRENLLFAARMHGVRPPAERVDMLLGQTLLRQAADRQVRHVSRGMRQRLALARALVHDPPILLLDEPFSGLDAAGREWLAELLRCRRSAGGAVCFTTHDEAQCRHLADRTLVLRAGRLAEEITRRAAA